MRALLISIIIFLFTKTLVNAQEHCFGPNCSCQLRPKSLSSEKVSCPACAKISKDKAIAKKKETERRVAENVAKEKAKKEASERKYKEDRAKALANEKVTEVVVTMPAPATGKTNTAHKKTPPAKIAEHAGVKTYMIRTSKGGFTDLDGNVLIPDGTFKAERNDDGQFRQQGISYSKGAPNYGIVSIDRLVTPPYRTVDRFQEDYNKPYYVRDIVDRKGKRHFNADSISFIHHIYGNWFLIGSHFDFYHFHSKYTVCENIFVYNILTKEKHFLEQETSWYKASAIQTGMFYKWGNYLISYTNHAFVNGKYAKMEIERSHNHYYTRIDNMMGGEDKWCALFFSLEKNKATYMYIITSDDKLIKKELSKKEASDFKYDE